MLKISSPGHSGVSPGSYIACTRLPGWTGWAGWLGLAGLGLLGWPLAGVSSCSFTQLHVASRRVGDSLADDSLADDSLAGASLAGDSLAGDSLAVTH